MQKNLYQTKIASISTMYQKTGATEKQIKHNIINLAKQNQINQENTDQTEQYLNQFVKQRKEAQNPDIVPQQVYATVLKEFMVNYDQVLKFKYLQKFSNYIMIDQIPHIKLCIGNEKQKVEIFIVDIIGFDSLRNKVWLDVLHKQRKQKDYIDEIQILNKTPDPLQQQHKTTLIDDIQFTQLKVTKNYKQFKKATCQNSNVDLEIYLQLHNEFISLAFLCQQLSSKFYKTKDDLITFQTTIDNFLQQNNTSDIQDIKIVSSSQQFRIKNVLKVFYNSKLMIILIQVNKEKECQQFDFAAYEEFDKFLKTLFFIISLQQ